MGNLPGSHGRRGFGHGHGGQHPGVFTGPVQSQAYQVDLGRGVGPHNQDPRVGYNQHPVANVTPPSYNQGNYPQQGYPPQGYPPQGYPPQGYPPQGYPPQGYPPQGYKPQGYPPQGYPPGYPQQGYPGRYPPQAGASMGEAACCGACMACLTCLLCSCCQGAAGGGMGEDADHEGNGIPATADVTSPHDTDDHH